MKYYTKCLLYLKINLILFAIATHVKASPLDSLIKNQIVINRRLDSISSSIIKLERINDSLNKELYYYRAKDDFYVMAIDRQGSHFEWLLATAIGLAGFLSYRYFQNRLDKVQQIVNNNLAEFKKETEAFKIDYADAKIKIYTTVSTMLHRNSIKETGSNKISTLGIALNYSISSVVYANRAYILATGEEESIIERKMKNYISYSNKILDSIEAGLSKSDNKEKDMLSLKSSIETIRVRMKETITNKNPEVVAKSILLRERIDRVVV